jgi:hypothetical protein
MFYEAYNYSTGCTKRNVSNVPTISDYFTSNRHLRHEEAHLFVDVLLEINSWSLRTNYYHKKVKKVVLKFYQNLFHLMYIIDLHS